MSSSEVVLVALDIGARSHAWAARCGDWSEQGTVDNTPQAVRQLLQRLGKRSSHGVRVLMEATGIYYLDTALVAYEQGAEVMIINPRAAHHFAQALGQRNKTDRLDAAMLLECLARMPFKGWEPPADNLLALRQFGRHLVQLTQERTAALNRLHAASSFQGSPAAISKDLKQLVAFLDRHIRTMREKALALIAQDASLQACFKAVSTIIGVADNAAVSLLGELLVLPTDMNARACVRQAGLDPRVFESGTSVHRRAQISRQGNKYLRRALFHPALVASQYDPGAKAFKAQLVARGKRKLQAIVAIMRKLLTALWIIVQHPQAYDPTKLYPSLKNA